MSDPIIPANRREFRCSHCDGNIQIPLELPPTTGPCPHCGGIITSPAYLPSKPLYSEIETVNSVSLVPSHPPEAIPPQALPTPVTHRPELVPQPPPYQEAPAIPIALPLEPTPLATEPPKPEKEKNVSLPKAEKPKRSGLIATLLVVLLLFLALGAAITFALREMGAKESPQVAKISIIKPPVNEANYIRIGWQKEAYEVLKNYMAATDTQSKTPFILRGTELSSAIEKFYGGNVIVDSDTPAETFSVYELSEEDRKRGLFMMVYDQPPQFDMKEFFRPLASLEVQYGLDEADLLLSTLARVSNFAMEPLRVHAFFKKTPEGLKLDWEIFAQTKYRTLQNFIELPEVGQSGVFRVFIVEDVPEKGRSVAGSRTYRIADPANTDDTARINVKIDSEMGRALSIINWRGTKENKPITRTATLELKWTGDPSAPELEISRFVCWEFLGLGGEETPVTASTK